VKESNRKAPKEAIEQENHEKLQRHSTWSRPWQRRSSPPRHLPVPDSKICHAALRRRKKRWIVAQPKDHVALACKDCKTLNV
jgi:hypothetical protein